MTLLDRILAVLTQCDGLFTDAESRVVAALAVRVQEREVAWVECALTLLENRGLVRPRRRSDRVELTTAGREHCGLRSGRSDRIELDFDDAIAFFVPGEPLILSTHKKLDLWRRRIGDEAKHHAHVFDGPISIEAAFYFPRPKAVAKVKFVPMVRKPTTSNLDRIVLLALSGRFFRDPFQVTDLAVRKRYVRNGDPVGVQVSVRSTPLDEGEVA